MNTLSSELSSPVPTVPQTFPKTSVSQEEEEEDGNRVEVRAK